MDLETIADRLRAVSLFREISDVELHTLAYGVSTRTFEEGEVVVKQGDPGTELFLVTDGEFQVYIAQESLGFEKELSRLEPGAYFGEIALITGGKRLASVRAVTRGQALVLARQSLLDLIDRTPRAAIALCQGLADYLAQARQGGPVLAFVNLDDYPDIPTTHTLIPARISLFCRALAIKRQDNQVTVALVNPQDGPTRVFLRSVLKSHQVEFVAISERDFDRYRDRFLNLAEGEFGTGEIAETVSYITPQGILEPLGEHETAVLLQDVLGRALTSGASDVHFEPDPRSARIRLRLDGKMMILHEAIPARLFSQVVSRLKVMSELDIVEKRLPQDGRLLLDIGGRHVEVRISITPCQGGEKVVLRLLNPGQLRMELEGIIEPEALCLQMRELFLSPTGLLLVCGPTGAGKTTTLYAGLNEIWRNKPTINIVTAEDPVEYELDFATQISVNRAVGLDFGHLLRTILRQDPDVILVGEIRDEESAEITIEAANTGHLVLSSLHTDFALEALTRLQNLNVKPYLLSGAMRGVICQRLVARICPHCKVDVPADDPDIDRLRQVGVLDPEWSGTLARGKGCDLCRGDGELGRVAVFEVLMINDRLRELIEANVPMADLHRMLTPDIFISMARFGRHLLTEKIVPPERIHSLFPTQQFIRQLML